MSNNLAIGLYIHVPFCVASVRIATLPRGRGAKKKFRVMSMQL